MSAKIAAALHEVMSEVGYVQKGGTNTFHNYRYAGEADLLRQLRPAMLKAGLLLIPSVESVSEIDAHGNVSVKVAYTMMHKDGEVWPHPIYAAGCGNDRNSKGGVGDKGVYKALTGASKYLLLKLFQIETGDEPEQAAEADAAEELPTATEKALIHEIGLCNDESDLKTWAADEANKSAVSSLSEQGQHRVRRAWQEQRKETAQQPKAA